MVNLDYTKEIGMAAGPKKVPKVVAVILLLAMAAGGWYVIRALPAGPHTMPTAPAEKAVTKN